VKIIARADASVAGVDAACAYACGPVGKGQGTNKKQVPDVNVCFWAWIFTLHHEIATRKSQPHL
jgi:hypothetical protein